MVITAEEICAGKCVRVVIRLRIFVHLWEIWKYGGGKINVNVARRSLYYNEEREGLFIYFSKNHPLSRIYKISIY